MKTKVLLSTCALAAFFAACTNEELVEQTNGNAPVENAGAVGADLASRGMNIILDDTNVGTRATNGKWESGDKFGLAWYKFEGTNISAPQTESVWRKGATNGKWQSDTKVYANHIFTTNDNGATFNTTTDVYQGAYYVYFPYEKLGAVADKVVAVNDAPQTGNFEYERFNHALHISALDFIKADEGVDPETQQLTKSFSPVPAVNVLAMNATPEKAIVEDETLGGLTITKMQINANGPSSNAVFASKATIQPKNIPQVGKTVEATREAVLEAIDGGVGTASTAIFKVVSTDYKSALITNVENPDYTLTDAREVRAFALPIKANGVDYASVTGTKAYPSATVNVGRLYKDGEKENQMWYELGTFTVDNTNSPDFIGSLKVALGKDATNAKSWQKIVRDDNNEWKSLRNEMTANLLVKNFKPLTTNIKYVEQWNDLVAIYNSLVKLGAYDVKKQGAPTFKLAADVPFENEIRVPVTGIKLETGSKKMIIAGEAPIQWPANIVTENKANIEVAEGATLNVGSMDAADLQADKVVINASIDNNGTIHAGVNASIGVDSEGLVNNALNYNKEGEVTNRVIVEYGAYVYPVSGSEGIVAYTVTNNDAETIGKINELLNSDNQNDHLASVNTLVIEGTTLDLNAAASYDSGSPYVDGSGAKNLSAKIKDVAIELNGGNIEKVLEVKQGTPNTAVASITAVGGDNTTTDVNTPAITVKDGTLTIESVEVEKIGKTTLKDVEAINNYGTIYANTNVEVEDIYNEGFISVGEDYTVTYSGNFKQENGGHYENDVRPATVYTPDAGALSKATTEVMSSWQKVYDNLGATPKTYEAVASLIQGYDGKSSPNTDAFIEDLNAWLEIYYGNDDHNVTKATLTADVLILFENQSSERLGLTKA